jgi:Co/Zn/Cd efflux system component
LTIALVIEAIDRMVHKSPIEDSFIMLLTASIGLFINFVMGKVLHAGGGDSAGGEHDHKDGGCCHGHGALSILK